MEGTDLYLGLAVTAIAVTALLLLTESGALAVILGLAFLLVVGYITYVLMARLHDKARHGKPIIRKDGGNQ